MGAAMAANLLKAGHEVTIYNRTAGKTSELSSQGAHIARDVADACRGDAVITMLANDAAVEAVTFDKSGILASLGRSTIHISMSTISVGLAERLAAAHATRQQPFVCAPVFGRPDAAAAGKLFIVAAGPAVVVERCMPLFEATGQKTFNVHHQPQSANLIKLAGNFLTASVIEALGEAMALVGKAGIDSHMFADLISTLWPAPLFRTYSSLIADRKFEPPGFAAPLGAKDIRLALEAAGSLLVPMPLASLLRDRFLELLARGGESLDWSAIGGLAAQDAGGLGTRAR
jgi:3-hydroxyisobutyrate dehydrogenase-like beta-hydroxyacid dehydrogenase